MRTRGSLFHSRSFAESTASLMAKLTSRHTPSETAWLQTSQSFYILMRPFAFTFDSQPVSAFDTQTHSIPSSEYKMSAYLSGFSFTSLFTTSTAAEEDDGYWQEPSTMKPQLTANASLTPETIQSMCENSSKSSLTGKHNIAYHRNRSLQLHYAAPSA